MSKGRLPAILLNADFYSKGRNIRWMKENGYESIPILQAVWIASSQEKDCKISKDDAYSIPFLLTFDFEKIKKILDSAVEVGLLDGNETHYWNSQIVKDAKKFQSKHNNYSRASKERERAKQEQDSARILPKLGQNHIDTDIDNESDNESIKEKSQPHPVVQPMAETDPKRLELARLAEDQLVPADEPTIQKNNQFISAGRRPMRKYPEIWLTPLEFVEAVEIITAEGVPRDKLKNVFQPVAARIRGYRAEGRDVSRTPAFTHLTTFGLAEALKVLKASKDLKRSETYLAEAKR